MAEDGPVSPKRWRIIRRLFEAAAGRAPAVRAAFLARSCGGDLALRREVETLLAADAVARDGRFLRDAVRAAARRLGDVRGSGPECR